MSKRATITENNQLIKAKTQEVFEAGIEAGKKAEYDAFWGNMYPDLNNVGGTYTFAGRSWNDYTFNPPQVITLKGSCNSCFYNSAVTDISKKVSFKNVTSISSAFQFASTKVIGNIDVTTLTTPRLTSTFANSKVVTIGVLKVVENTTYPTTFDGCTALENIRFDGEIGNNISFADSPLLSQDSIESIITHLADFSSTDTGDYGSYAHTLTLSDAAWSRFATEDPDTATSASSLCDYRKWNLVTL